MSIGGPYGTGTEWDRAELPLKDLDQGLSEFAATYGFELSKNEKNWPERSLRRDMPLSSLMQIYHSRTEANEWNFWVVCYEDRGDKRYWKQEMIANSIMSDDLKGCITKFLEQGMARLTDWNAQPQDLEFATHLQRP